MFVATIVSLIAILFSFLAKSHGRSYCLSISFGIITLFLCLRYMWGNDLPAYYQEFQQINSTKFVLSDLFSDPDVEIGWVLINRLFKPLGFLGLQFFLSIFQNFIIYRFIKDNLSKDWYWFAVFIYCFLTQYMVLSASMLRQFFAICIFLYSYRFIVTHKLFKYVLCILLAASIHRSSLILLPVYFLGYFDPHFKFRDSPFIVIFCLLWYALSVRLFGKFLLNLLSYSQFSKYQVYVDSEPLLTDSGTGLGFLFNAFIICFTLCQIGYVKDRETRLFVFFSTLPFFIIPLGAISPLIGRIGMYFSIFSIVALPIVFSVSPIDKRLKMFILFFYIIFQLRSYVLFFYSDVWNKSYFVYHSIFGEACY